MLTACESCITGWSGQRPNWHHRGVDQRAGGRKRHLSLVPDLPESAATDRDETPLRAVSTLIPVPPLVEATADDLRRRLAESGAPQPFLDHAARFGDDVEALAVWLRDYGPVFSEKQWAGDLLDHWSQFLVPGTDAIAAEQFGAAFLAMYDDDSVGMIKHLIAEAVETGRRETVAMARVFASVGPIAVRSAALAAVEQLLAAEVPDVEWADDVGAGRLLSAYGWSDPAQSEEMLVLDFEIAGRPRSFSVLLDHSRGSGVKACQLHGEIGKTRRQFEVRATIAGLPFMTYTRTQAGNILAAALVAPIAARRADDIEQVNALLPLLRSREHLVVVPAAVVPMPPAPTSPRQSTRVSRVHRLKVTLTHTRPPIWRRLEVPSTATLAELHDILQVAFGWADSHLWMFETPTGEYGRPDPEMGFMDAGRITLADAAPDAGSALHYVYDFGDDWRHSIVVEAVEAAAVGPRYPRCTGGRRAAPPEDSGGAETYEDLLAAGSIVAGRFSAAAINERLQDS
ncbi:pRiA4b ORF-3-like protein [Nakamurella panacisegetis]|uniref:PRiA4b ORF-3-like protein n=1 Tax=Nakamurella panacisegetis TaxID=1090615 RepID=A0A1H0PQ05_9ACTN|nr:pRiA4b ORF-3-like protein [Nakamurella panacisegetis]